MKTVIITSDRFACFADLDNEEWFRCTECECECVAKGDNYCCNCGSKITWRLNK